PGPAGMRRRAESPPRPPAQRALPARHPQPPDGHDERRPATRARGGVPPRPRRQPDDRRGGGKEIPHDGRAALRGGEGGPGAEDVLGLGQVEAGGGFARAVQPVSGRPPRLSRAGLSGTAGNRFSRWVAGSIVMPTDSRAVTPNSGSQSAGPKIIRPEVSSPMNSISAKPKSYSAVEPSANS